MSEIKSEKHVALLCVDGQKLRFEVGHSRVESHDLDRADSEGIVRLLEEVMSDIKENGLLPID